MVRRTIAMLVGLVALGALALLPSTASAQTGDYPPFIDTTTTTSTTSTTVLDDEVEPTTTTEAPTTTVAVEPDQVTPPTTEQVMGDVVRRPLPRTGSDLNGTAVFGGAMTILGIALALGARRRRNAFDGS